MSPEPLALSSPDDASSDAREARRHLLRAWLLLSGWRAELYDDFDGPLTEAQRNEDGHVCGYLSPVGREAAEAARTALMENARACRHLPSLDAGRVAWETIEVLAAGIGGALTDHRLPGGDTLAMLAMLAQERYEAFQESV